METKHPFEIANLGVAPFKLVRVYKCLFQACPGAPVKAGASCDYCATSIAMVHVIRDANGAEFKVGSECCLKTGDRRLIKQVKAAALTAKHEADAAKIAAAQTALEAARVKLSAIPHPSPYRAAQGDTLATWAEWMLAHAGTTGKLKAAKVILQAAV